MSLGMAGGGGGIGEGGLLDVGTIRWGGIDSNFLHRKVDPKIVYVEFEKKMIAKLQFQST